MFTSQRTLRWTDPGELADTTRGMSGSEFFTAWKAGDLIPPMAATLGFELADFSEGRVEIGCVPSDYHYNPYGTVHGGLAATLIDTATGCAVHTRLPAGTGYATVSLNITYLRPLTVDVGAVRCLGTVTSLGKRVAVADAELVDNAGRQLAKGTASCLVIPGPG
jgi:uncharacterized protein (TIGR00369 family)